MIEIKNEADQFHGEDNGYEVGRMRWIPVSESNPKADGFYISTLDGEIVGEDKPIAGMAEFHNGKWVDDEDDYQCVLAWMPLPCPWKGDTDG